MIVHLSAEPLPVWESSATARAQRRELFHLLDDEERAATQMAVAPPPRSSFAGLPRKERSDEDRAAGEGLVTPKETHEPRKRRVLHEWDGQPLDLDLLPPPVAGTLARAAMDDAWRHPAAERQPDSNRVGRIRATRIGNGEALEFVRDDAGQPNALAMPGIGIRRHVAEPGVDDRRPRGIAVPCAGLEKSAEGRGDEHGGKRHVAAILAGAQTDATKTRR